MHQLRVRTPIEHANANYVVLGLSFLFEIGSWIVATKEFGKAKGDQSYWQAIRRSKDSTTFTVLLEDSAALGIVC